MKMHSIFSFDESLTIEMLFKLFLISIKKREAREKESKRKIETTWPQRIEGHSSELNSSD